ncbi:succinyl-CoA synthetase beta chain [Rhodobacteraceae bacterium KLH11]|nr:succinyl-CoA synthetase beta chain [Rhodobacteraceae bacterium KLH11]
MFLSEQVSKELLSQYGLLIPEGRTAKTPELAEAACKEFNAKRYVVKALIPAGGRGLAGGVKFAATPSSVREIAENLLGSTLVTEQTNEGGERVDAVYVEAAIDIAKDYFIAIALDPGTGSPLLLASSDGGVEFEQRSRMDEGTVRTHLLAPESDESRAALEGFLKEIGIEGTTAIDSIFAARRAFCENDMTLLEINPFARTATGDWMVIDAKVLLDGNTIFRHPEFETMAADLSRPESELEAQKNNINLVKLTGNVGVVANGAGLGLATHDMLVDAGGDPANFMDIRTTAKSFDVAKGVELLLGDPNVKVILLNVHGGGMTAADTVAEGINFAYSRSERQLPVIAHISGQNAEWGIRILRDRKVPVETFDTISDAVSRVVEIAR